jgi:sulfatase modifying factor 1
MRKAIKFFCLPAKIRIACVAATVAWIPVPAVATTYALTELSGITSGTDMLAINNFGTVVTTLSRLPVVWQNGIVSALPLPSGMIYGSPSDINDEGVIAGSVRSGSSSSLVMWLSGSMQTLPLLSAGFGTVNAINNAGVAVGSSSVTAVRWAPTVESLGTSLGGNQYRASGINNNGQIVGAYTQAGAGSTLFGRGFLWQSGTMTDIGEVRMNSSHQNIAINDVGQIAGRNSLGAFIWQSGSTTQLPLLEDATGSALLSINDTGTAVGYTIGPSGWSGYLWSPLTGGLDSTALGSFPGWELDYFTDINDSGQIVGRGSKDGVYGAAFLLTPVPEPSTWALGLMAIACGGWVAWRKRKRSPVNRSLVTAASCLTLALAGVVPARGVTIDMVTVGDGGNVADDTGYGTVSESFQIGKYEMTIGQYADFLNAAAKSDPYSLFNTSMESDLTIAGISRSGSTGSYIYSVIGPSGFAPPGASSPGNRPITYVSWFDAARFANWMHNGQGAGGTETGAYTLNGATSGDAPARNPGAKFYIPTEDEWYKAAYYKGGSTNAGYWNFATQSDGTVMGNAIGSASNQANYRSTANALFSVTQSSNYSFSQNYLTDVGAFTNSQSGYGTFDQSGNVYELNDLTGVVGSSRGVRGGTWSNSVANLSSSTVFSVDPDFEDRLTGFRLAAPVAVPEPSTWLMGLAGLVCGACAFRRRRP